MKKSTLFVSSFYLNNRIFDLDDTISNRDNCMYPFALLRKRFEEYGYILATQDINNSTESDFVLYNDIPVELPKYDQMKRSFLLLFECELTQKTNWDITRHTHFRKIFTWHDEFIDDNKYIKMNFTQKIPDKMIIYDFVLKKYCTIIAGNKKSRDSRELYSERIKAIEWFEKNHPQDFDFYGMGWEQRTFTKPFGRLNRLQFLRKVFHKTYSSWKGKVKNKATTLSKFKFCICYENALGFPGYITEKIFDCFFAGCIPIYLGAPNITDYIPPNTFIDKRYFNTYEELDKYLLNMKREEYDNFLYNIQSFISGPLIYPFSAECFAETIVKNILND